MAAEIDRFAAHASPEAIEAHLRRARIAVRTAQREVERLTDLLDRRTAERDAGTWPATGDREAS